MRLGALTLLLAACGDATSDTSPLFDPTLPESADAATAWLSYPFPADHRRTAEGTIDLRDFPNPGRSGTIDELASFGSAELFGFSTTAPIWAAFDGALDTSELPTDFGAYRAADAPLQIVDITAGSPTYGRRWPLRWELFTEAGSYVVPDTLAVSPAWGFPLRERTTYAFIMTDAVHGADGKRIGTPALLSALMGNHELARSSRLAVGPALFDTLEAQLAPLRALLDSEGSLAGRLIVATVFTTQDVTSELAALHAYVSAMPPPQIDPAGWQELGGAGSSVWWRQHSFQFTREPSAVTSFRVFEGRFAAPNFQHGTPPYNTSGGGFRFVDGQPEPARSESLRLVISVPELPPAGGAPCYPVVQYAHGTGGSAFSFVEDQTAGRLAARGIAGVSIDQPLHGPRSSASEVTVALYTFNYANPESARAIFRESAAETFSLTRLVRDGPLAIPADKSPTGQPICFDGERLAFFGHSQGGIVGSLAASFEDDVDAWMLSAAGGTLSITLIDRSDPIYVAAKPLLFDYRMLPLASDVLTYGHPVIGLLQTLVDVADPINYSPLWLRPGGAPPHGILLTSGHHDEMTPHRSADALAVAAGLPLVEPVALAIPEYAIAGIAPVAAPVRANVGGETAGFIQWTNDVAGIDVDSHFVVFGRREAINASMRFLETAVHEAAPVIERLPNADVR